jgi:glycosyltransferase involved in cell wall biosynthesis
VSDGGRRRALRIAVDARDLLVAERTGVERVAAHFIAELARGAPGCEPLLLTDRPLGAHEPAAGTARTVVAPRGAGRWQRLFDAWIAFGLGRTLRDERVDAFYSVNTKFPLGGPPAFVTVHGVEWHFHPQGYRTAERIRQWLWFQLATRFAAGIVTFAEHTRRDIRRMRPGCRVPIAVVPEGVDPMFRRLEDPRPAAAAAARLGISGPYLLSVCSLVPRKNIDGLLRAYALLRSRHGVAERLLLVGRAGWRAVRLRRLATDLGLGEAVVFAGYVDDATLVALYNGARAFVYPSKYEGFGLPPLEAMRCGVPVVTSGRSATAEIAAGAAVLVDPDRVESIAAGILQVLTDPGLRERLIAAGLVRTRDYDWPAMAAAVLDFVRDTLDARRAAAQ